MNQINLSLLSRNILSSFHTMAQKLSAKLFAWILASTLAFFITPLQSANAGFYRALPDCRSGKVQAKIIRRFEKADSKLWYTGDKISSMTGAREQAYNIYDNSLINRRYCSATAHMANGTTRRVDFVIEQHMGLAGFNWGVEYCLRGSDNWHAYNGWCRVLRR